MLEVVRTVEERNSLWLFKTINTLVVRSWFIHFNTFPNAVRISHFLHLLFHFFSLSFICHHIVRSLLFSIFHILSFSSISTYSFLSYLLLSSLHFSSLLFSSLLFSSLLVISASIHPISSFSSLPLYSAGGCLWEIPFGQLVGEKSFETLGNFYTNYGKMKK